VLSSFARCIRAQGLDRLSQFFLGIAGKHRMPANDRRIISENVGRDEHSERQQAGVVS